MTAFGRTLIGIVAVLSARPADRLSAQDSFPPKPPPPAPLAPVRFPPFQQVMLPNGMTLLLVENHEQPVVSVNLSFLPDRSTIPPAKKAPPSWWRRC